MSKRWFISAVLILFLASFSVPLYAQSSCGGSVAISSTQTMPMYALTNHTHGWWSNFMTYTSPGHACTIQGTYRLSGNLYFTAKADGTPDLSITGPGSCAFQTSDHKWVLCTYVVNSGQTKQHLAFDGPLPLSGNTGTLSWSVTTSWVLPTGSFLLNSGSVAIH